MKNNIAELTTEYNKTKAEFIEKMKVEFKNLFTEFFAEVPEITSILWRQYTPYFNDGDPCVFSAGDFYFVSDKDDQDEDYDYEDDLYYTTKPSDYAYERASTGDTYWKNLVDKYTKNSSEDPRYEFVMNKIGLMKGLLGMIPDEIYLATFEDHVKVVASRNGFEVEEYDHE